jgi:hypothetical protein
VYGENMVDPNMLSAYPAGSFALRVSANMFGHEKHCLMYQSYAVVEQVMQASFGLAFVGMVNSAVVAPLVAASPADACSSFSRAYLFKDAVVLTLRGNCTFSTKVSHEPQPCL